ncbi:MAG: TetR/AcrR family transcriptional regulator [Aetokthonos hydrillicola CCALA 1050]|nr:TetR/AcrR family transcriptional regulator [Aetokthonos hydrillicola CCALA 1050]MBW4587524.1 TetR/AcrR family transcriptional regulator [Aetokthonos hydrillicola CCALA 1050]
MECNHLDRYLSSEKVEVILEGAMREFLAHGFAATTMDQISAAAGVSKTTIYNHFGDKQGLFNALIQQLIKEIYYARFNPQKAQSMQDEASVILHKLAVSILNFDDIEQHWVAFFRLIVGESGRFPDLARAFVRNMEQLCIKDLTQFLGSRTELNLPDPEATARIFSGTLAHFLIIQELLHGKDILPMEPERLIKALIDLITLSQSQKNLDEEQYSGIRHKSSRRKRSDSGQFASDYQDDPKRLRSIRLTDTAWEKLAAIAAKNDMTRSEIIEIFARNQASEDE